MITALIASIISIVFTAQYISYNFLNNCYISGSSLRNGDWWRVLTAPFIHLNMFHIAGNLATLLFVGLRTEKLIGPVKFTAVFIVSACVGALGSAAINPPDVGSVGASGAIQGLFSALYVAGLARGRRTEEGRRICRDALGLGLLGMAYSSISGLGGRAFSVDLTAHVFGGVAGGLAAIILLMPGDETVRVGKINRRCARIWKPGAVVTLGCIALSLLSIIVYSPALPYAAIHFGGTALLILIALVISLNDSLGSSAPAAHGVPYSFRRMIYTRAPAIVLVLSLTGIWAICMYFR